MKTSFNGKTYSLFLIKQKKKKKKKKQQQEQLHPPSLFRIIHSSPLSSQMKPNSDHHQQPPKLKAPPRPLFSCSFFRNCSHCSHSSLSPTSPSPPPFPSLPPPPPQPPPPPLQPPPPPPSSSSSSSLHPPPPPSKKLSSSSSSSSSASTSQSFTQWKFPLPSSPPHLPHPPPHLPPSDATLPEAFNAVELHLSSSNPNTQLSAFHVLERALPTTAANNDRPATVVTCPHSLMHAVVSRIRDGSAAPGVRRSAAKILLSLCLAEPNRRVAVEAGAVGAVVEGAVEMAEEGAAAAERALAALELMCTVWEGAEEVRGHALAVPAMVGVMGRVEGRGREHAMGVLAVAFGGGGGGRKDHASGAAAAAGTVLAEEVAKAVELALKGECSERGKRKGKQLLKLLRELNGDGDDDAGEGCRRSISRDSTDVAVNST